MSVSEQDLAVEKPILVTLDAQEIGVLTVTKVTPYGFIQYLLAKLKQQGGPVEGVLDLRITHGRMLRIKESAQGKGFFDYLWLPDFWLQAINDMGGLVSMDNPGGVRV